MSSGLTSERRTGFITVDTAEVSRFSLLLFQQPLDTGSAQNGMSGMEKIDADISGNAADVDFVFAELY